MNTIEALEWAKTQREECEKRGESQTPYGHALQRLAAEVVKLRTDNEGLRDDLQADERLLELLKTCAARLHISYQGDQEWVLQVTAEVEKLRGVILPYALEAIKLGLDRHEGRIESDGVYKHEWQAAIDAVKNRL